MLATKNWTATLVLSASAVLLALVGLGLTSLYPGAAAIVAGSLLAGSLGATAGAFTLVALRVRRLELENEGLIEEISQEFDRVKDKLEIFGEALEEPRSLTPADEKDLPLRRVMVK